MTKKREEREREKVCEREREGQSKKNVKLFSFFWPKKATSASTAAAATSTVVQRLTWKKAIPLNCHLKAGRRRRRKKTVIDSFGTR